MMLGCCDVIHSAPKSILWRTTTRNVHARWKSQRFGIGFSFEENISLMTESARTGSLTLHFTQSDYWRLRSAADAIPLAELEPRAVRQHFIVPSICSREIAWT